VDLDEAYQPLYILRRAFLFLFLLLLLSGGLVFFFMVAVERLQAKVRKSAVAAKQLGQYVLDEELGAVVQVKRGNALLSYATDLRKSS
jgi:hypothetical protein